MKYLGCLTLFVILELSFGYPGDNRVVNGTNAKFGEFPFIASLRRAAYGTHSCGCTILNGTWLLTAAHCVANARPSSLNVQYGVTDINTIGPNIANISQLIVHENYQPSKQYLNDIALIKLSSPLKLSNLAKAVKLPKQGQVTPGDSPATLIGWGLDKTGGSVQINLQKVNIKTFSKQECSRRHNNQTHPTNICAGVENGGKGQCNGDSGGPLLVKDQQVGIVSWSVKPCTVAPYPGVFTEVSAYITWIKSKTGLNL